ncbi:phasin family protein [Leucothrix sargassi]|nr:phasin family protein [Leucothrix sargassi]
MATAKTKTEAKAKEAFEKTQEFASKQITSSEKAMESMIEFNAAMFKNSETVAKKMYDNYLSNVAAGFEGMKALNKASDISEYYKVAGKNSAAASERFMEQSKELVELSGKMIKETAEAGQNAYSKSFAASL